MKSLVHTLLGNLRTLCLMLLLVTGSALHTLRADDDTTTTEPTYTYIQFSGNGRCALLDTDGALSAETDVTDDSPTGDGYQWTLESTTVEGVTNPVLLKSKAGRYVKYDETTSTFSLTETQSEATAFVQSTNTYYNGAAGSRYNLTLASQSSSSNTANTLGVKNGKLLLVKPNSRYAVVREATSLTGAAVCPLLSTDTEKHPFAWILQLSGTEYVYDDASATVAYKSTTAPTASYNWTLEEANELGDVYIKSNEGRYLCRQNGSYQQLTTTESTRNSCGVYRLVEAADNSNSNLAGKWFLKNTKENKYIYPYNSTNKNVGYSSSLSAGAALSFTTAVTDAWDGKTEVLQFTAQGSALLHDGGTASGPELKAKATGDDEKAYLWTLEASGPGHLLKSGNGNYLKYANSTFSLTTSKSEATPFVLQTNTYASHTGCTRYDLRLANESSKFVSSKGGQLTTASASCLYTVVRLATDVAGVKKGTAVPVISQSLDKLTNVYKIKFKTNAEGSQALYLTAEGSTFTAKEAITPVSLTQNWAFIPAQHSSCKDGDFYLVNEEGKYLIYDSNKFQWVTSFNVNSITAFRFLEDDVNPESWYISMALSGDTNRMLGLATSGTALSKTTYGTDLYNALSFEASTFYEPSGYLQFSGLGTWALCDNQTLAPLAKKFSDADAAANYTWTLKTVGIVNQYRLKSGNGNYICYDAEADALSLTTDSTKATTFERIKSTYAAASKRYNFVLASDATKALSLSAEGKLYIGSAQTRFATLRFASNVVGPQMPTLSTDEKAVRYLLHHVLYGKNFSNIATTGKIDNKANTASNILIAWTAEKANDLGDIYLRNWRGSYLAYTGGYYQLVADKSSATTLRLEEFVDNGSLYTSTWGVRPYNQTGRVYMNQQETYYLKGWDGTDSNSRMTFEEVDAASYVLFPALGSVTLSQTDAEGNDAPCARTVRSADVANTYQWTFDNGHLLNLAGNYLTYNDDTQSFGLTTEASEAYTFSASTNTYETNNALRFNLLNTDGTKALSADLEGTLSWGEANTRYSVVKLTNFPAAPTLPVVSTSGSRYELYYLRRDANGGKGLTATTDTDNNTTLSLATANDADMNQVWIAVRDDNCTNGDCYLQNLRTRTYLHYNTTSAAFELVSTKAEASRVRLTEADANYDAWQLQLADITSTSTNFINFQDFGLNPTGYGNNYMRFVKAEFRPEFYTYNNGDWRYLQLGELENVPQLIANGTTVAVQNTPSPLTPVANILWRNIGSERDFVLRNGEMQYLKTNSDGSVELVADSTEAAHFYLWFNHATTSGQAMWCIAALNEDGSIPSVPGLCLGLDADNATVKMLDYTTIYLNSSDADHHLCFGFSDPIMPPFTNNAAEVPYYVYISFDKLNSTSYLTGGGSSGGTSVFVKSLESINDQFWTLQGRMSNFTLRTKDHKFVTFNSTSGLFETTMKRSEAAHFSAVWDTNSSRYNVKPVSGTGLDNYVDGTWYVAMQGSGTNLTLRKANDARSQVLFTDARVFNGEDYPNQSIRPKRSWFVKEASEATGSIMTGFIQPTEGGFITNPYSGKTQQKTNTYTVTHYLKAGTNRTFVLPTCLASNDNCPTRLRGYQRWYNYRTDGPLEDSLVIFTNPSIRRYNNGIVMGTELNFNNAYGTYVGHRFTFQMPEIIDDDYVYELGLDASTFTDFVDYFGDNGNPQFSGSTISENAVPENQDLIEPTLSGRNLFIIRNARSIANELLECKEGSDKWLEEQTIHFPKKKITFASSSFSMGMQFQDYWYYKGGVASEDNLQSSETGGQMVIEVDDALGTGITSAGALSASSSGMRRFIAFNYPGDTNGTGTGEAKADECVFKIYGKASDGTRYQLAKVTLHFDADTEPLIYSEVIGTNDDGTFKSQRSPEALRHNVGDPVAAISFNPTTYDSFVTPPVGKNYSFLSTTQGPSSSSPLTYRYPLLYDNSNYAFAPVGGTFNTTGVTSENTWGSYSITHFFRNGDGGGMVRASNYPVLKLYENLYGSSKYDASKAAFLYIDASDLPGRIASLDFEGSPCPASRLFVSAWIYSANDRSQEKPAQVVFNVVGITAEGKEVTIYSYCPGSIFNSARTADGTEKKPTTADRTPLWQQVYFSFINSSTENFTSYKLNIDNACTNTAGGDILIDEVQVYAFNATVELSRTTPVCDQQITLTKMVTDFDAIMQQLGLEENEDPTVGTPQMWYCLLDKDIFDAEMTSLYELKSSTLNKQQVTQAMLKSLIGDPTSTDPYRRAFRSVEFTTHYTDDNLLPTFNYKDALAVTQGTRFKETTSDGVRHFVVSDKMQGSGLKANHWYYLLFCSRYSTEPITTANAVDAFNLDNDCRMMSAFKSASAISVIQDGDGQLSVDGASQVCAGKSVALSVKLNGSDDTGAEPQLMFYYDWWRDYLGGTFEQMAMSSADGSVRELQAGESLAAGEVSLREALQTFRHFYPNASTLVGAVPQADEAYDLKQFMIDGLTALTQHTNQQIARLSLLNTTCNVYVPSATPQGQKFTVTLIPVDNLETQGVQYCFDPQHIQLQVSGYAPGLYDGYSAPGVVYPAHLTSLPVRSSLSAVKELTEATAGTAPAARLRIPLRSIRTITEGATGLKMVGTGDVNVEAVYLAGTNDPTQRVYDEDADGNVTGLRQVGTVTTLEALAADSTHAHADLYFSSDFTPREGYTYSLRIDFKERFEDGSTAVSTTCDGSLTADLIIVPAYQVWTGAAGNNEWTCDLNWARADRTDLQLTDADTYLTNKANGTAQGFAPMLHTSVVLPSGAAAYPSLYATATGSDSFVEFTGHEGDARTATANIEYALLAEQQATQGLNTCQRYTPYTAADMALAPAAEVAGTHLLTYTRAWMEYSLKPGRWYTLGSPLKDTYAGDWYAPTTNAQQLTPYFAPVTYDATLHNRFAPAVYQRSWDVAEAKLYYLDPYSATQPQESNVHDDRNVYLGAMWSHVYNNVQVPYSNGGFSVKVASQGTNADGTNTSYTTTRFRLPKEDTEYSYYTTANATDGKTYAVSRPNAHRLLTDDMATTGQLTVTLKNNVAANAYYLVANPFTCGLNMAKFFEENAAALDGAKYWLLTEQGQMGVMQNADDAGWTTVNAATSITQAGTLAPGQGFFVKAAQATGQLTLTFTPQMMAQAKAVNSLLRISGRRGVANKNSLTDNTSQPALTDNTSQPAQTLRLRATRDGLSTEALVVKTDSASNLYASAEDMETMLDNTQLDAPTVYTLAGHTASSINRRSRMQRIPVGILSKSNAPVRLTISGMHSFTETLSLLDAASGAVTPLTLGSTAQADSVTLEVPGVTTGRYYILTSDTTPEPADELTDQAPLVQVVGQKAQISSTTAHPLSYVHIVDAEGRTLYQLTPFTPELALKLPAGLYVVEAHTDTHRTVAKISVQ